MTPAAAILCLVTAQRAFELGLARRNTRALLLRGAREAAPSHYIFLIALHAAWLLSLWILARNRPMSIPWLSVFVLLQAMRAWVIATLGRRWTTRIIVLPGTHRVRTGPYRWLSHPNYAVVIGEIAVLPLAFGLTTFAALFTLSNLLVLFVRVRAEDRALGGVG